MRTFEIRYEWRTETFWIREIMPLTKHKYRTTLRTILKNTLDVLFWYLRNPDLAQPQ